MVAELVIALAKAVPPFAEWLANVLSTSTADDVTTRRVREVLPEVGESEKAAEELRGRP